MRKLIHANFLFRLSLYLVCTLWSFTALGEGSAYVVFSSNPVQQGQEIDPGAVKENFGCGEAIHAVAGIEGLSAGDYMLESRWMEPGGEVIKKDESKINIPRANQVAYMSTSITVQQNDSGSGNTGSGTTDSSPYAGTWKVEVFNDDESIGSGSFDLDC